MTRAYNIKNRRVKTNCEGGILFKRVFKSRNPLTFRALSVTF